MKKQRKKNSGILKCRSLGCEETFPYVQGRWRHEQRAHGMKGGKLPRGGKGGVDAPEISAISDKSPSARKGIEALLHELNEAEKPVLRDIEKTEKLLTELQERSNKINRQKAILTRAMEELAVMARAHQEGVSQVAGSAE